MNTKKQILLSQVLLGRKALIRKLNDRGITTLQQCAKIGTKRLVSLEGGGVGIASLLILKNECRRLGVSWPECDFETRADQEGLAFASWIKQLSQKASIQRRKNHHKNPYEQEGKTKQ